MTSYPQEEWLYEKYHQQGLTLKEIAEIADKTPDTIKYHMEKYGIERRSTGPVSDESPCGHVETIDGYKFWVGDNVKVPIHNIVAIADGADPYIVFSNDYIVHHQDKTKVNNSPTNLEVLSVSEHASYHYNQDGVLVDQEPDWHDEEQLEKWYWDDGMTMYDIADVVDVSQSAVKEAFVKFDIETRSPGHKAEPWHDEDTLREMYIEQGMSQKEIADSFDISPQTAGKWLRRTGVIDETIVR